MFSWLKKLQRFFRRSQHKVSEQNIKREISELERERAKEHNALLKQRRFYEKLLHRNKPEAAVFGNGANKEILKFQNGSGLKPTLKPEIKPEIKSEIKPEIKFEPKPEMKAEPIVEIKHEEIPIPKFEPKPEIKFAAKPELKTELKIEPKPEIKFAEKTELKIEAKAAPPEMQKPKANFFANIFARFMKKSSLAKKLAEERIQEEAVKHKVEVEERFWQPYNSVKANLIKDQGVLFFNWKQRLLTLSLALVLSSLAIGLVYVGLLIWQKERLRDNASTLANFEAINTEISKNEREIQEIVGFNRKLDLVSFILTNHVYWSNFFKFLEANTLKDVYFEKFTGDLTGKYNIPAVARNLDFASAQLEVMKAYPMVLNVQYLAGQTVADSTGDGQRTKFNLEISVDPKIFVK